MLQFATTIFSLAERGTKLKNDFTKLKLNK